MSEGSSAKTPDSGGQKALEDIRPEHGALVGPTGPPVALGPQVNPFWSESVREEAILRACRPSHLPSEIPDSCPPVHPTVSPPRELPDAVRTVVQGLMQENARLWTEREMFATQQAGWNQSFPYGGQPAWMASGLGDGQARGYMGSMMDAMKSVLGSQFSQSDGGLLGALAMPGERSSGFSQPRMESGVFGNQSSGTRGNLMDMFNMVAGVGQAMSMHSQGGFDLAKGLFGPMASGRSSEGSLRARGAPFEHGAGSLESHEGQGRALPRDDPQESSGVPAGDPGSNPGGQEGGESRRGEGQGDSGLSGGDPGPQAAGDRGVRKGGGSSGAQCQGNGSTFGGGLFGGEPPQRSGNGAFPGGGFPGSGGYPGGQPGGGGFPGGRPGGDGFGGPPGGGWPGGGFPGGFPGGPPGGGPPDGGFPGGGPGGAPFGNMPAWLGGLMAQQESIRAVELPCLLELSELEVGPLVAGDWITTIGPFLRDMSSSSSLWWDEVLRVAGALYRLWLGAEPMERLRLVPVSPPAFRNPPWLRIEQRGSVALLKAVPESLRSELVAQREVSSISIMFKVLKVYQPGGLGERTTLLKQLVDQKVPAQLADWLSALRSWRRWLTRVHELGIQPPDPVLLLSTLDRFAAGLAKQSPQVAFRVQVTRAALRVDTAPTDQSIQQLSESLLAEGEAAFHGGSWLPIKETVKVKALDGDLVSKEEGGKKEGKDRPKDAADLKDTKDGKDQKGGKTDLKPSKGENKPASGEKPVCRYFLSDSGCKKGQKCSFPHEWKGVQKQGRCWNCGSTQHMKPDCPVKDTPRVKKEFPDDKKGKEKEKTPEAEGSSSTSGLFQPPTMSSQVPTQELVNEAVQLLKSLRPSVRVVTVCAVNKGKGQSRALLDGGATHILRPAVSKEEFEDAVPIKVELAAGVATLRQVQTTGTLVTDFDTQLIVPLGKVVKLGYKVSWEGEEFLMLDPKGKMIEVQLDAGCPTVDLEVAKRLIQELESHEIEMVRRVRALRAGEPGDLSPSIWRWLSDLRKLWPEVPDDLLARVIPSGQWSGDQVPLNRHQRKRLMSSSSVIVHLFSGPDQAWWRKRLESNSRAVVCIDKMVDPAQDLLSDQLTSFLAELCQKGTVDALLGGPPCRTVSKLRFRQPGPPPLRARSGPERFALESLTDALRELAWNDAVLWMRQLWLYSLAAAARPREVLFLKEHPRDPEEYKGPDDPIRYPSFFAWPEWKAFVQKYQIREVRLDFGALGHERRKPTTLGTNIKYVHQFDGLTDRRPHGALPATSGCLGDRTAESRSWAAWPMDFKIAVSKGILLQLDGYQNDVDVKSEEASMAKMTTEQWRLHVLNDHMPYARECTTCLQGGGRGRQHRKVPHPDAMTLSLDICGPFRPGEDHKKKSRYFMVGVFAIPVKKKNGEVAPLPLRMEEMLGEKSLDEEDPPQEEMQPILVEEEVEKKEGDEKAFEEWLRLEVEAEDVEIQNYTMVETLSSRQGAEVKACLARMIARLKYLGLDVRRVHSDGAAEMQSTRRWCEERGLYRTFTSGSDWKANGRAEAEIGVIRRSINTLIRSAGEGEDLWPLMAKHVGERRGRQQLAVLGFNTPMLMPWGQKVMVTTKGWDDFQGHWRSRKKPGVVRGPDPDMSLTSGGHLVEMDKGKYVRTNDMVVAGSPPSLTDVVEVTERDKPASILDKTVKPPRRLTEKTALAKFDPMELQQRLCRGQAWANREFQLIEANLQEYAEAPTVLEMDEENEALENFLTESGAAVRRVESEGLADAEEEEVFLQTRTIGLGEVKKNLQLWIPPLRDEIGNFDANQAIHRVTEEEANNLVKEAEKDGRRAEIIPGMGVFTRKAGDGRRRARIVCCGNYMESRTGQEVYATGADSTQLRATLRVASMENWDCLTLDVKSAFLLAPKAQGDLVIVKPPRILVDAQLAQPGEHWVVSSAMYGLVTSPKDWSVYRDSELLKMRGDVTTAEGEQLSFGFQPLKDANLWAIKEVAKEDSLSEVAWGRVLGYMIVYVDDILMVGQKELTDEASSTIQKVWSTSSPEYAMLGGAPMRFLGIEIQRFKDGTYYLHQGSYVREVLDRHGGGGTMPFIKVPEEPTEERPSLAKVKEAQKLTGELLWLSGKTRPDIAWAVMRMSQFAVKKPGWTVQLGEAVLSYVRATVDYGLHYPVGVPVDDEPDLSRGRPRTKGTVEVLVDASFSPGDSHSVSGTIALLAGCPIQWDSRKQSLMALSTAEAELTALVEGLQTGRSIRSLVELLLPEVSVELYNDNRAALVLASGAGGGWRTRHLRIRASCLAESLREGEVTMNYRAGSFLWADALTKALPAQSIERFCKGVLLHHQVETVSSQVVQVDEGVKISKCMAMMLAGMALLPPAAASEEVCEKAEKGSEHGASVLGDLSWMVFLAGLVCLLHVVKDLGLNLVKRLVSGRDHIKVKLLSEDAIFPQKGSEGAAGWDLSTVTGVQLGPGERKLVSSGVAFEIPRGHYGRVASRSSLASQGVEVAGGVIDADYRGEVKVILVNQSDQPKIFEGGDRVAQIIFEKMSDAPLVEVASVSSTRRGEAGFGSSGVSMRRLAEQVREGRGEHEPQGRNARVPDSPEEQVQEGTPGVVSMNGPMPTNLLFDVYTSRGGENMVTFLERLRGGELRDFAWFFSGEVMNIVCVQPVNGMPHECVLRYPQGIITLKLHRHGGWRKKLFDSELSVPMASGGLSSAVVTIAWLDDGRLMVRSDFRKGSHGMHYLKQRWSGYSILARASEISMASGRASGSGC